MATAVEAEFDQKVITLRETFAEYPGANLISSKMYLTNSEDFPKKGILFFDCLPIFENPHTHNMLVHKAIAHLISS